MKADKCRPCDDGVERRTDIVRNVGNVYLGEMFLELVVGRGDVRVPVDRVDEMRNFRHCSAARTPHGTARRASVETSTRQERNDSERVSRVRRRRYVNPVVGDAQKKKARRATLDGARRRTRYVCMCTRDVRRRRRRRSCSFGWPAGVSGPGGAIGRGGATGRRGVGHVSYDSSRRPRDSRRERPARFVVRGDGVIPFVSRIHTHVGFFFRKFRTRRRCVSSPSFLVHAFSRIRSRVRFLSCFSPPRLKQRLLSYSKSLSRA